MPGKVRVSALARELGITSKDALARLAELGVAAKSAVSTLEHDVAERLRAEVASPSADDAATEPAEPTTEPVAQTPPPAKKAARKRAAKKAAPAAVDFAAEAAAGGAGDPAAVAPGDVTDAIAPPAKKASRKRASKKTAAPAEPLVDTLTDTTAAETGAEPDAAAAVAPGVLFMAPDDQPPPAAVPASAADGADSSEDGDESDPDEVREAAIEQANGARRRRRRGRRGRGGGNAERADAERADNERADNDGENDDAAGDEASSATAKAADTTGDGAPTAASEGENGADDGAEDGDEQQSSSSRRRRRRRRSAGGGDSGDSSDGAEGDDPPNTVTHVRDAKKKGGGGRGQGGQGGSGGDDDGVRGVKGSTRLEAKRQRRRDGRDTSRRRAPILTEAEFLARREAVDRVMAVRQNGDRTQIAVLEDDVLVEHYVTRASATSYVGNVYLGRVQNVLPSMEAAFIDIGKGRNGVLYAGEVNWDAAGLEGKSRAIEQALKSGDTVLVQVTKDPIGHKGARLTSQISLPGRFLVYVPGGGMTGISRRLPDTERHRLKAILKKIVPEDAGVIVRTAAEGASEEDLTHDVERLQAQWETIKTKSEQKKGAPVLLHGEPDLAIRVVRDVFNEDFESLVVEGDDAWATVSEYLGSVAPDLAGRVKRHTKDTDLFHDLRVDEQLMKALDRKVWLPSGGSLVIDRTEAMTVIDVNTGKFVGSGGNLEQTVTRNNLEAAEEIVHQLRLRDVGGIVVIDFIDMVLESNRELVLRRLTECLGRDRTKHQVAEVTSLGLVQMTRKRVGEGLLEAFSEPCEVCKGRGVIIHAEPVDQPSGGNDSSSDDDRPRNGKRRRGGRNNGSNGNGNGAAPEPDEVPAANDEQRRAAAAAIAAIHRAAGEGDDGSAGDTTVSGLATDLVEAVMRVDSHGSAPTERSGNGAAAVGAADRDAADAPNAEQPPAAADPGHTPVPEPVPVADEGATEPSASQSNGASTGASNGGRRRRRSASRPAGPPVPTT